MKRLLVLFLLLFSFSAAAAVPELRPATTGPARIRFSPAPGLEAAAERLAPRAEAHLARIEADLAGLPRVEEVEVRLVRETSQLGEAAPPGRGAPEWASGVAYPDAGVVVIAARGADNQLLDMESTLSHELAHMAIERALGEGRVPRWLHEGFAYQHSSDFTWDRAQTLALAELHGHIIPLTELDARFPAGHDGVQLAYAESYDFVGWLAHRGRYTDADDDGNRAPFRDFLAQVSAGSSIDTAAIDNFGKSIVDLDREWQESLSNRYLWFPVSAAGGLLWVVLGALAVLGWLRRRRQMRRRLEAMEIDELLAEAARLRERERLEAEALARAPHDSLPS